MLNLHGKPEACCYFPYGEKELDHLRDCDPAMAMAITRYGPIQRQLQPDLFLGISHTIIGQQISNRAQATIWSRVLDSYAPFTACRVLQSGEGKLRACGVSEAKTRTILGIAREMDEGRLSLDQLSVLPDEKVKEALVSFRGIGPWTAEMVLIFTLARRDIFSERDLGVRKGLGILHGKLDTMALKRYRDAYSPFGTIACFYLWAVANDNSLPETFLLSPSVKDLP